MGCGYSKDHPKNADLIKLKKKYETDGIKSANLLHIWVVGNNIRLMNGCGHQVHLIIKLNSNRMTSIGASKTKTLQLAEKISIHQNYLLLTEDILLQRESAADSDRASILKEIVDDKGVICPGIILDLVVECILERLDEIKGVVYHGIPRDREHALHLQRLVGPVSLVIYCELKGESLRAALTDDGEEPFIIRHKVNQFEKSVLQISKHKTTVTVDGEKDAIDLINECLEVIERIATEV